MMSQNLEEVYVKGSHRAPLVSVYIPQFNNVVHTAVSLKFASFCYFLSTWVIGGNLQIVSQILPETLDITHFYPSVANSQQTKYLVPSQSDINYQWEVNLTTTVHSSLQTNIAKYLIYWVCFCHFIQYAWICLMKSNVSNPLLVVV